MIKSIIFSLVTASVYFGYFFVVGCLASRLLNIQRHRFLISYALGTSIIVGIVILVYLLGADGLVFVGAAHFVILALVAAVFHKNRNKNTSKSSIKVLWLYKEKRKIQVWFTLMILFSAYHISVGAYTEIPSDVWKHLARVGIELASLDSGHLGDPTRTLLDRLTISPIYMLHALAAYSLGVLPVDTIDGVSLFTGCMFISTTYFFSFLVLDRFRLSENVTLIGAAGAALLTFISLGTAGFAYGRYYAYFPTIFAYPLIFASAALVLDYLQRPKNTGSNLLLVPLFLVIMYLIHAQEALLTLILLSIIVFVRAVRTYFDAAHFPRELRLRARTSAQIILVGLALTVIYAFVTRTMNPWQHTPHIVDLGRYLSIGSGLPLDNPGFRFWDTIGYFGVAVYLLWLFQFRRMLRSDFLAAGMLVPVFTNLNPLYAVVFLHFGPATGLWRTAYLVPLGTMAATLGALYLANQSKKSLRSHFLALGVCAVLFASMLPWTIQQHFNRTSRIPSLVSVDQSSGLTLWDDLIHAVAEVQTESEVRRIITDSVTKFVLYSSTRGQMWWWPEGDYFPRNNANFERDFRESDFSRSLLVVNKRNGGQTLNALHAGHWPPDILEVSKHYPRALEGFVERHPELFQLIWAGEKIHVYQMYPDEKIAVSDE